jgi:hypothetical protein
MKAKSIILAAVLALQINVLLADNTNSSAPAAIVNYSVSTLTLAPATPMEATFEESVIINDFAEFETIVETFVIDNGTLSPVTPAEASFE